MSKVYRVGSYYGTEYFGTVKAASSYKPGGEEPESVDCVDAAEECMRLMKDVDDAERSIRGLRMLLEDLVDVCPNEITVKTLAGQRASKFCKDNPLPPADAADRDGGRSYGT